MGKTAAIGLGAVVIGVAFGFFLSASYGLTPTGGLPLVCAIVGIVTSAAIVSGYDLIRSRTGPSPANRAAVTPDVREESSKS